MPTSGIGGIDNQGTEITIYGTGFGSSISDVIVKIGKADCNVTNCADNNITCHAGLSFGGLRRVEIATHKGNTDLSKRYIELQMIVFHKHNLLSLMLGQGIDRNIYSENKMINSINN